MGHSFKMTNHEHSEMTVDQTSSPTPPVPHRLPVGTSPCQRDAQGTAWARWKELLWFHLRIAVISHFVFNTVRIKLHSPN